MSNFPMTGADAIRLDPADNVATVLRPIAPGETVRVRCGDTVQTVRAEDAIPLCHKISLAPIAAGVSGMKYGHQIGAASAAIAQGRHVHVHNLTSVRARA